MDKFNAFKVHAVLITNSFILAVVFITVYKEPIDSMLLKVFYGMVILTSLAAIAAALYIFNAMFDDTWEHDERRWWMTYVLVLLVIAILGASIVVLVEVHSLPMNAKGLAVGYLMAGGPMSLVYFCFQVRKCRNRVQPEPPAVAPPV